MVSVRMRKRHRIEPVDSCAEHLLTEVGAAVDDDARDTFRRDPLYKRCAAETAVFRLIRIAISPITVDARNSR